MTTLFKFLSAFPLVRDALAILAIAVVTFPLTVFMFEFYFGLWDITD